MLKVLQAGFFTTLQDLGRFGYRDKGVPVSGVMDAIAVTSINQMLSNKEEAPVLEITMTGPKLEFTKETYICLGGAAMSVTINDELVQNYKLYHIKIGDIISYGKLKKGFRGYLAIKGGFASSNVLGSTSYYRSIKKTALVKNEDTILYNECNFLEEKKKILNVGSYIDKTIIEVYKGPEYKQLTDKQLEVLFFKEFTVAKENNRMAYQLKEKIMGHKISMLTSATLPGTVQFTPSGKLIVLMKDAQTTGGYPRILQLTEKSISILSQKRMGDNLSFKLVEM